MRCAMESLKSDKAVGGDGIVVEILHARGDFVIDQLISLFQHVRLNLYSFTES